MAAKYNVKIQYAAWVSVLTLGTVVVMTGVHLHSQIRSLQKATRLRAQLTARSLAKAIGPALATSNTNALPGLVAINVSDDEVYYTRILDRHDQVIYRPWRDTQPSGLELVREPVMAGADKVGMVEVGLGRASMSEELMHLVYVDSVVGLLMVGLAVAVSFWASRPVQHALQELYDFVSRVAQGDARSRQLDSDLSEVDEVGTLLNDLMARVQDAQGTVARAQKQLKAAQKEMDEYTYVISHDLKEPLRGIEAFSKFLLEGYRDKLDEDGRHHIDVIRNSVLRMQRLINDLLKFSRLGQQKNPLAPVGLNTMLMHVRVNLQYRIDEKKVDLRVNRLPTVVCDATAMTEVFHNLISNAIKYNDKPHPVVEVGCEEKPVPDTDKTEYEFYVRDNGIGIKQEYFEKIFQLFQRLQRDDEGTGIGLTIVKRVVEWHGGRIWVQSEPDKGTTFYFTLPKRDVTPTGTIIEPAPTPRRPKEGNLRRPFDILLVEDNPADVEITIEAFRRSHSGNRIHVCRDGEEAIEFLFHRGRFARANDVARPDLILLDLNLPRKSGAEVLELIKQTEQLKEIPVVVLTTSDRDEDVQRCYRHGANSYLTKPVQFDDCLQLVAHIQQYWLSVSKLPPR